MLRSYLYRPQKRDREAVGHPVQVGWFPREGNCLPSVSGRQGDSGPAVKGEGWLLPWQTPWQLFSWPEVGQSVGVKQSRQIRRGGKP